MIKKERESKPEGADFASYLRGLSDQCFISKEIGPATLSTRIKNIGIFHDFLERRNVSGWQDINRQLFEEFDNWHQSQYQAGSIAGHNQTIRIFIKWLANNDYPLPKDVSTVFTRHGRSRNPLHLTN